MNTLIYATTLEALLSLEGDDFIECCFQTLLHRQPAPDEKTSYLRRIQCDDSKMSLVERLAGSVECNADAAKLPGLKSAVKRYKQSQTPIVGWLFRCLHGIQAKRRKTMPAGLAAGQVIRLTPKAQGILRRLEAEANSQKSRKGVADAHHH